MRILKGRGSLYVKANQEVTPEEIIGIGEITSGFRTINLSTELSVSPNEVGQYLTRNLGQRIYKGELLAFKKGGLFKGKQVVIAPTDGILDFLNIKTGELKISLLPKKVDLLAGVYGIVEDIDAERGHAVIRTQVSQVRGILGFGKPCDGMMHILDRRDVLIPKSVIQPKYGGHILVGGSLFFKETISSAISAGVSGIITGGINAQDYKEMASGRLVFPKKLDNDIGIGILICEGFGSVPIADDIFKMLSAYEGRFVFLDGNKALINLPSFSSSSLIKVKNTQLPKLPDILTTEAGSSGISELEVGLKVRIIGNSYFGEQGKLLAIDNSPTLLPSKIKTYLATVETSRRKIQVPVANLEIIR
ncbi:hypothetical protein HYU94_02705 [Candidatus Daviesbacteria bacterium]|nr:hypothetical protein [Candidatus Daviesbacteria bacterium]